MLYKPSFSADRSLSLASITDKFIWRDISSGVKLPTDSSWNYPKITNFILISKLLTWFIKSCLTSSSVLLEVIKTKTPDWNWCSLMGRWLSFSDLAAWRISSETSVSNHEYIDLEIIAASMFLCLGAVHKLRHFKIDLCGSSNNDSTWCYIPSRVLNNYEWLTKFTSYDILPKKVCENHYIQMLFKVKSWSDDNSSEDFKNECALDLFYPFNRSSLKIEFWVRCHSLITSSRMKTHMVS